MVGLIPKGELVFDIPNLAKPYSGIHITAKQLSELGFLKGDKVTIEIMKTI